MVDLAPNALAELRRRVRPPAQWTPAHTQAWNDLLRTLQAPGSGHNITEASSLADIERAYLTSVFHGRPELAGVLGNDGQRATWFNTLFNKYAEDRGNTVSIGSDRFLVAPQRKADGSPLHTAIAAPDGFRAGQPNREREWNQMLARLRAAGYNPTNVREVHQALAHTQGTGADLPPPAADDAAAVRGINALAGADGAGLARVPRRRTGEAITPATAKALPDTPQGEAPPRRRRRQPRRRPGGPSGQGDRGDQDERRGPPPRYDSAAEEADYTQRRFTERTARDLRTVLSSTEDTPERRQAMARLGVTDGNLANLITQWGLNDPTRLAEFNALLPESQRFRFEGGQLVTPSGRAIRVADAGGHTGYAGVYAQAFGNNMGA